MNAAVRAVSGSLLLARSGSVRSVRTVKSVTSDYPYYHKHSITKPRAYINYWEKMFWSYFIAGFILSGPAWILYHHREYSSGGGGGDEE